jgi:hypothetical protein
MNPGETDNGKEPTIAGSGGRLGVGPDSVNLRFFVRVCSTKVPVQWTIMTDKEEQACWAGERKSERKEETALSKTDLKRVRPCTNTARSQHTKTTAVPARFFATIGMAQKRHIHHKYVAVAAVYSHEKSDRGKVSCPVGIDRQGAERIT